jgi:protein-tyrosine phosphatase
VPFCGDDGKWEEAGVKSVINCTSEHKLAYARYLPVLVIPLDDHSTVEGKVFELAVRFHTTYGATLVHCGRGKNRSSTICIALLCHVYGVKFEDALSMVSFAPSKELMASLVKWRSQYR